MDNQRIETIHVLRACQELYQTAGMESRITEPAQESPFYSCITKFPDIGDANITLMYEIAYLPVADEFEKAGICFLQSFVEMFKGVKLENLLELGRALHKINLQLTFGAFGIIEEGGILFFKHICREDWPVNAQESARKIDIQNGIVLHQLNLFMDSMIQIAQGKMRAEQLDVNTILRDQLR